MRKLALVFLVFLVTGCSATGPSYEKASTSIPALNTDKARLYFMRDSAFMGSGMTARVHVNGLKISGLPMDGFFYTDQNSGDVLIMVDAAFNFGDAKTTMKLEKGQTYYFLVGPNSSHITSGALWGALGGALGGALATANRGDGPLSFTQIPKNMGLEKLKTKRFVGGGSD